MSSGSACWILWLTPMDWLALSIGRSGSQPLEYSIQECIMERNNGNIEHTIKLLMGLVSRKILNGLIQKKKLF